VTKHVFTAGWLCAAALLASSQAQAAAESALVRAVQAGDTAAVRALVKQAGAVKTTTADGTTALHWAARSGDATMLELLIRAGADVNATTRYGVTPLTLAVRAGRDGNVLALLAAGAKVAVADAGLPEGQTLLMHAARTGNIASMKALLAAGSDPNAKETRTETTAVAWAAVANRGEAVKLLAEAGADLNLASKLTTYPHTQNGVGLNGLEEGVSYVGQTVLPKGAWTATMMAAREGAVDAVRALADAGANLDAQDPEGTTALIVAIINGHYDVARVLADGGADVNLADVKGMTPLYAAVDMHTLPTTFGRPDPPPMVIAGAIDAVKMLLAHGARPDLTLKAPIIKRVYNNGDGRLSAGATAFMRAARGGDLELMKLLQQAGADPTLVQKNGSTALMMAAGAGSGRGSDNNPDKVTEDQVMTVIKYLVDLGVDINAAGVNGDTAAHVAATTNLGSPKIIRFMHGLGADFTAKNKAGRTPLQSVLRAREVADDTVAVLREITGDSTSVIPPDGGKRAQDRTPEDRDR
jgi:ankyrin repeat protein